MDYLVIASNLSGLSLSITIALVAVVMGIALLLEAVRCFQQERTEGFTAFCEREDAMAPEVIESVWEDLCLADTDTCTSSLWGGYVQEVNTRSQDLVEIIPAVEDLPLEAQAQVVEIIEITKEARTMSWYDRTEMAELFVSTLDRVRGLEFQRIEALC